MKKKSYDELREELDEGLQYLNRQAYLQMSDDDHDPSTTPPQKKRKAGGARSKSKTKATTKSDASESSKV